jgi:hypothetical protein
MVIRSAARIDDILKSDQADRERESCAGPTRCETRWGLMARRKPATTHGVAVSTSRPG